LNVYIKNTGEEVFNSNEIKWELFIPYERNQTPDVIFNLGEFLETDELISDWKFQGYNEAPLFVDEELKLIEINFDINAVQPGKIYYRIRTIGGNFPTLENVTDEFFGLGFSVEDYPKVGELILDHDKVDESQVD
jgi:hypothetical protein